MSWQRAPEARPFDQRVEDALAFARRRIHGSVFLAADDAPASVYFPAGTLTRTQAHELSRMLDIAEPCWREGEAAWGVMVLHVAAMFRQHPDWQPAWNPPG